MLYEKNQISKFDLQDFGPRHIISVERDDKSKRSTKQRCGRVKKVDEGQDFEPGRCTGGALREDVECSLGGGLH